MGLEYRVDRLEEEVEEIKEKMVVEHMTIIHENKIQLQAIAAIQRTVEWMVELLAELNILVRVKEEEKQPVGDEIRGLDKNSRS